MPMALIFEATDLAGIELGLTESGGAWTEAVEQLTGATLRA